MGSRADAWRVRGRLCGLRDLGWDVGSQFLKGLPGRPRCQRKGQEGAVWARTLGHVGLRLGSEQAWGREGQRNGPVRYWDADLQLGRVAEDTAQPRRHRGRGCEASSHLSRQKLFLESELKVMGGWYWGRWGLWFEL